MINPRLAGNEMKDFNQRILGPACCTRSWAGCLGIRRQGFLFGEMKKLLQGHEGMVKGWWRYDLSWCGVFLHSFFFLSLLSSNEC